MCIGKFAVVGIEKLKYTHKLAGKFEIGFTLHTQAHSRWKFLKILLMHYSRREKIICQKQTWWSFSIDCN